VVEAKQNALSERVVIFRNSSRIEFLVFLLNRLFYWFYLNFRSKCHLLLSLFVLLLNLEFRLRFMASFYELKQFFTELFRRLRGIFSKIGRTLLVCSKHFFDFIFRFFDIYL